MINRSREKEKASRQEGSTTDGKFPVSSRQWLGLRNPRIVRVSRAFGGKDRHSKVSTIRGLRDRRVRLSVPTAIQLYDLQNKLGVDQPSKAVDWLLAAAQHEIDKLPPLPFPPASFTQLGQSFPISTAFSYHHPITAQGLALTLHDKDVKCADETGDCPLAAAANDRVLGNKAAELAKFPGFSLSSRVRTDASMRQVLGEGENDDNVRGYCAQVSDACENSLTGSGSNLIPYYYHLNPANSNAYEHQFGGSSSSPPSVPGSQLVFYASGGTPSMFPPYTTSLNGSSSRHSIHIPSAASQDLRSSSETFLRAGSHVSVRPSQPRSSSAIHRPFYHHEN
ncbi:hypothetical protein OPV22_004461 [Ensete ventricosum]|uniref:TCP domain-containing protein n=1 Tax=Ensete ventricosum TaxID=4639 RepID=A0AAV8S3U9_ENSVE|nr:hypothetical protein OPV22_004461 [Ensete ventricosum]